MSRRARRPDPPPLDTDDSTVVLVGTGLWAVALVVMLLLRVTGAAEVRDWWLAMCVYGIVLGLVGVRYVRRRQEATVRDAARGVPPRA